MKPTFKYRNRWGNLLRDETISKLNENEEFREKLKENRDDLIRQCDNTITENTYICITIGEDNKTFQNSLRGDDKKDGALKNFDSIYPLK